jgi:hypothetical protein
MIALHRELVENGWDIGVYFQAVPSTSQTDFLVVSLFLVLPGSGIFAARIVSKVTRLLIRVLITIYNISALMVVMSGRGGRGV